MVTVLQTAVTQIKCSHHPLLSRAPTVTCWPTCTNRLIRHWLESLHKMMWLWLIQKPPVNQFLSRLPIPLFIFRTASAQRTACTSMFHHASQLVMWTMNMLSMGSYMMIPSVRLQLWLQMPWWMLLLMGERKKKRNTAVKHPEGFQAVDMGQHLEIYPGVRTQSFAYCFDKKLYLYLVNYDTTLHISKTCLLIYIHYLLYSDKTLVHIQSNIFMSLHK